MDLDGEDDESEDLNNMNEVLLQEDGEQVHLPDEWISDLQHKQQGSKVVLDEVNSQSEMAEQA
jgi:hypothetical protein